MLRRMSEGWEHGVIAELKREREEDEDAKEKF